ncbi:MoaD/ThiS family protein [Roseiconus nitratireducens]|uniref:MoaD/ThiS family protein n=1 Tax=Roseiconus nitratireducens TaxID=2605748 RepID=A0A5M6DL48_9BACT|nr:MoaD/ThiS family protein [Roseiconus nitratireducens]KAA5547126.1 MoaD/ThiS family protein [Roseiconus nitratireducens]
MNVVVEIPSVLQSRCGVPAELRIPAASLGELFEVLRVRFPELHHSICDETGHVRRHVNLFHNSSLMTDKNPSSVSLTEGDVVHIFQAVSGG